MLLRLASRIALLAALAATPALAKDLNCENRAARSAKDCMQACNKMKEQPELKNSMKSAKIGSCEQMCAMVEDQSAKACESKKKERRNR